MEDFLHDIQKYDMYDCYYKKDGIKYSIVIDGIKVENNCLIGKNTRIKIKKVEYIKDKECYKVNDCIYIYF